MAYKKKPSLDVETVLKLGGVDKNGKAYPKQIEGFYVGARTVENEQGISTIHVFQTAKGNVGIWGSKTLNTTLSGNDVGYMVRVTYLGKKKLTKGRTQHMYDIEIDEDQRSDEVGIEAAGSEEDTYEASEETEDEAGAETSNSDYEDTSSALSASSAAERKAKVQALVNKRK